MRLRSSIASRIAIIGVAGLLLAVPAGSVQAQSSPSAQSQAPTATAPDLSEQKLDAVAAAVEQVAKLERDFRAQIEDAPAADRQRIVSEANDAIARAVTDQGLSVEEYGRIIQVAANDPDLRQKILQRLPSKR
jgi:hypothetical protein